MPKIPLKAFRAGPKTGIAARKSSVSRARLISATADKKARSYLQGLQSSALKDRELSGIFRKFALGGNKEKIASIKNLGRSGKETAFYFLSKCSSDPNPNVRAHACLQIGLLAKKRVFNKEAARLFLEKSIAFEKNSKVTPYILDALDLVIAGEISF